MLYTLVICFIAYLWNVICPDSNSTYEVIGLTCYNHAVTWNSLWPTLFSAQLILIAQVMLQLAIYNGSDSGAAKRKLMVAQASQRPIFFLSRLSLEVDRCFRVVGSIVTYVVFLVVAFVCEVSFDNKLASVTVIGLVQLLFLFSLLSSHVSNLLQYPRGNNNFKRLWRAALFTEACILVSRYVYQFAAVETWILSNWPLDILSLEDIGYVRYSSTQQLSKLFIYLFPTALVRFYIVFLYLIDSFDFIKQ